MALEIRHPNYQFSIKAGTSMPNHFLKNLGNLCFATINTYL